MASEDQGHGFGYVIFVGPAFENHPAIEDQDGYAGAVKLKPGWVLRDVAFHQFDICSLIASGSKVLGEHRFKPVAEPAVSTSKEGQFHVDMALLCVCNGFRPCFSQ